jgi:hypothetical protein
MECTLATLHTLIACFSWSNLYVDGGMQFNDYDTPRIEWRQYTNELPGVSETVRYQEIVAQRENPYGRLALGYEVAFPSVSLRFEASHLSSIATSNDRGLNAISFSVRWYPFR